jgi:hypothetical protein
MIQGYSGIAVVDAAHQVIVEAQAHGTGSEQELLLPVLDACAPQCEANTLFVADAGYHSEANLAGLAERGIDALIADPGMRRRDERLAGQDSHRAKPDPLHDKSLKAKAPKVSALRISSWPRTTVTRFVRPASGCTATATAWSGAIAPSSSARRPLPALTVHYAPSACANPTLPSPASSPCSSDGSD